MKPNGILLLLCLAANIALLRAEEPAKPATTPAPTPTPAPATAPNPDKPSPQVMQKLSSVLPRYAPPPPPVAAKPVDPDMIELPKMTVTQKKRPRLTLTEEVMMTPQGFNEKLAKENLGAFDRDFLNKFTLPLFGTSAESRAREEYDRKKRDDLAAEVLNLAKAAEVVDPAQAKAMRDAVSKP